ncbi:MAG TPA: hypothetical protein ENH20_00480 [Candidatus Pacearchaeota archaeon]|nr:hypothetical protein [Candidatus Pacearchaeota archaeon]
MRIRYDGNVDINLSEADLRKVIAGGLLSKKVFREDSGGSIRVNISSLDKRFYSMGGLAEAFDSDSFQGWVLESPLEKTQLAFPWGEEKIFRDYNFLDIKISRPVLTELIEDGEVSRRNKGYFCGMTRGVVSGHSIDRLNLHFFLAP